MGRMYALFIDERPSIIAFLVIDRRVAGDSDDEEEELAPLRRAQALIRRLRRRDLYKYCQEVLLPSHCADNCFVMPTAGGEGTAAPPLCQTLLSKRSENTQAVACCLESTTMLLKQAVGLLIIGR